MSSSAEGAATATNDNKKPSKWFPLESNPQLINKYISNLGFDTNLYEFVDVYSTEDWALEMIPQPVAAVVMLYPLTPKQEGNDDGLVVQQKDKKTEDVWFIKQRIGNACGTIGVLHSVMNAPEPLPSTFKPDSWLQKFAHECHKSMDPIQKAERLEGDQEIAKHHDQATSSEENSTSRGSLEDQLDTHFVALVCIDNQLYELDGRKEGPVCHGPTTQATLLQDACKVVKKFMERDPEEMRFTIMALAPKAS
jgi:ubiquitin carboxyl-terminal hydrolase L3